ncbi:MAG: sortase, partial [Colwelliaceae bacterium]|nr:sortase [Colwelliaceae bacterium]
MLTITFKILILVGGIFSIHAIWLPTKAWLSQELILYSWHQSVQQQKMHRKKNTYQEKITTQGDRLEYENTKANIKPWPWADTFPIAELSFMRLEKSIVILNGGDPTTLAFSAGAIAPFNKTNSATPFVVAGHSDSHFSFLENILMKDVISMKDQSGKSQLYQVEAIDIINAGSGQLPILADDSSLIL